MQVVWTTKPQTTPTGPSTSTRYPSRRCPILRARTHGVVILVSSAAPDSQLFAGSRHTEVPSRCTVKYFGFAPTNLCRVKRYTYPLVHLPSGGMFCCLNFHLHLFTDCSFEACSSNWRKRKGWFTFIAILQYTYCTTPACE
jgi:hypothetical protein